MSLSRDNVKAEVFLPGVNARIIKKTNKQTNQQMLFINLCQQKQMQGGHFLFLTEEKNAHDHENKQKKKKSVSVVYSWDVARRKTWCLTQDVNLNSFLGPGKKKLHMCTVAVLSLASQIS